MTPTLVFGGRFYAVAAFSTTEVKTSTDWSICSVTTGGGIQRTTLECGRQGGIA